MSSKENLADENSKGETGEGLVEGENDSAVSQREASAIIPASVQFAVEAFARRPSSATPISSSSSSQSPSLDASTTTPDASSSSASDATLSNTRPIPTLRSSSLFHPTASERSERRKSISTNNNNGGGSSKRYQLTFEQKNEIKEMFSSLSGEGNEMLSINGLRVSGSVYYRRILEFI